MESKNAVQANAVLSLVAPDRTRRPAGVIKKLLANNPFVWTSLVFMAVVLIGSILVEWISPHDPFRTAPLDRLLPPSSTNLLGTDDLGRDVFTRLFVGARTSLLVGFLVMVISALIGTTIGLTAGYYEHLDGWFMRVMDAFMSFPSILLAVAIMAALGPNTFNVVAALSIVYVPRVARLVRGETLNHKNSLFVESARSIGAKDFRILFRYILPNALSPLIVQCTFIVAYAITAEASLSFLGAGVPPEIPTWGNMLREGQRLMSRAWWMAFTPGIALFGLVLSLNVIGDGLRDALDPRQNS